VKQEIINVLIGFLSAIFLVFLFWLVFVSPCDVYTPVISDEKRCRCFGKKIDFEQYFGNFYDYNNDRMNKNFCVGLVLERH